ncbi:uncharacterized protein LOC129776054 isoform X2 [Toxorhynchites rutilus septentrionalis]|uniref:uncharacterized protein LOC129776054 isoform X2 n=1 Tax=Toxorhynchites rutilus septentrionalis TaxID=329112 RepID=UPI0024787A1B|nr:uncharacterized protein LOC129776054 isoform X2 [Toxorhynchites rutilus septentrionalis]
MIRWSCFRIFLITTIQAFYNGDNITSADYRSESIDHEPTIDGLDELFKYGQPPNPVDLRNSPGTVLRRKTRAIPITSISSIPIPTIDGSDLSYHDYLTRLPSSIISLIGASSQINNQQPWQLISTLATSSGVPVQNLDRLVEFFTRQYSSVGQSIISTTLTALDNAQSFFSGLVNSTQATVTQQVWDGLQNAVNLYQTMGVQGRSCVGDTPATAGRRVVEKAIGCIADRWNEALGIVQQFRSTVALTNDVYGLWLQDLGLCNAQNFANETGSEQEAAQRSCYARVIARSASTNIINLPVQWANLIVRASNAIGSFQPQLGLCAFGVAAEVAAASTSIGFKIAMCGIFG